MKQTITLCVRFSLFVSLVLFTVRCDPDDVLPFIVNTTQDTADAFPGDNICADVNGLCSLRAAVEEANTAQKTYLIDIPPGTYHLDSKLELQTGIATFRGTNSSQCIIDGQQDASILFHVKVHPGQTLSIVALSGLTLKNAHNDTFSPGTNGGGGAVRVEPDVTLVLSEVRIEENRARFHGAAIYNKGTVSMADCIVRNNATSLRAGGAFFNQSSGTLTLHDCAIYNNTAGDQQISNGNYDGGAFYNLGSLAIYNSTISGNEAKEGIAGGIYNAGSGTVLLNNCTVSTNIGDGNTTGAGIYNNGSTVTLRNSIVARNYISFAGGQTRDLHGTVVSGGGNLIGTDANLVLNGNPATPDQVGTVNNVLDPQLTALMAFQGTFVHKVNAGSPAINSASPLAPGSGSEACRTLDQAGQNRLGVCDCGAFERQ